MIFTKHHIIKYLKGELPHFEQHEMERMMLEDPFLSDAIEGLQEIKDQGKLEDTLLEIEKLIESNYGRRRVLVPVYKNPLAIAAVISLLVVSVAVILLVPDYRQQVQSLLISGKDKESSELPVTEPKIDEEISSQEEEYQEDIQIPEVIAENIEEPPVSAEKEPELSNEQPVQPSETTRPITPSITDSLRDEEDNVTLAQEVIPPSDQRIVDTVSAQFITSDFAVEAEQREQLAEAEEKLVTEDRDLAGARKAAPAISRELPGILPFKEVSGMVTSGEDNQPLAGVNVIVSGTSKGTITNANGSYTLKLLEDEDQIQFSFIGFQPFDLNVANSGTYNVEMSADTQQLSEVVVIGANINDNRTEGSDRFAEPEIGRRAYNLYLRDNLNYPDSAVQNNISGRVVVEFMVGIDGSISNLEVTRGLGFGCDEEAIRLIQEGPVWQPAIRNGIQMEERVRVSVRFKQ